MIVALALAPICACASRASAQHPVHGDSATMPSRGHALVREMFEARNFAIEFPVQMPALQEIEHRPKTEFTVTLGLRVLF